MPEVDVPAITDTTQLPCFNCFWLGKSKPEGAIRSAVLPEIANVYIRHAKPDNALLLKFTPSEGALWKGSGGYNNRRVSYIQALDKAGEELLELIGKHRQVASAELLSVEHGDYSEGVMMVWPTSGTTMQQAAETIGHLVGSYYQCDIKLEGDIPP